MKLFTWSFIVLILISGCSHTMRETVDTEAIEQNGNACPVINPNSASEYAHTKELCKKNPSCEVVSFGCYCPPDVQCICGGNPPAVCKPKD